MHNQTKEVVQTLQSGGVALIATDTVYGLVALPSCACAVEKIYVLKSRPREMFLPIIVANIYDLELLGIEINKQARKIFESHLVPGAITFILGFKDHSLKPLWLKTREEVAIRIPNNALLLSVLTETGPLLVTSANKHGQLVTPAKVNDILAQINGIPDIIIEDGAGKEVPSTIINCRYNPPVVEREGLIPVHVIHHILNQ